MDYEIVGKCASRILYNNVDVETVLEDAMAELGHTKDSIHYPFAKDILRDLIHEKLHPYDCLVEELSKHHNVTEISEEDYNLGNFPPIKSGKGLEKHFYVTEVSAESYNLEVSTLEKSGKELEKPTNVREVQDFLPLEKSKNLNRKDRRKAKKRGY